jgi:hypothetical protein
MSEREVLHISFDLNLDLVISPSSDCTLDIKNGTLRIIKDNKDIQDIKIFCLQEHRLHCLFIKLSIRNNETNLL